MEVYDVYMSIGWACRPAHQLRINGLRDEAFPLDWQKDYSLDTVIHLFETDFVDFFKNIKEEGIGDENSRRVIDIDNHIISLHHFPRMLSIEEGQKSFLETMKRRYRNQKERLQNAKKILLLSNRLDNIESLENFLIRFSNMFPDKEIRLLNIRDECELAPGEIKETNKSINKNLEIVYYKVNDSCDEDGKEYDWKGNARAWNEVLKSYGNPRVYNIIQEYKTIGKPIIIFGAGQMCRTMLNVFKKYGFRPDGIAVSELKGNPKEIEGVSVKEIDSIDKDSTILISLKNNKDASEIKSQLIVKGYKRISLLENAFLMR